MLERGTHEKAGAAGVSFIEMLGTHPRDFQHSSSMVSFLHFIRRDIESVSCRIVGSEMSQHHGSLQVLRDERLVDGWVFTSWRTMALVSVCN